MQKPTVILLHGLGSARGEWNNFAKLLAEHGIGVLIYDLRGHNDSTLKKNGEKIDFQTFSSQNWKKMVDDIGSAVDFLKNKQVDMKKIGIGGASIGANIAFRYAAPHKNIAFAILLSPGINLQGLTTNDMIKIYGARPLLMAASETDRYFYQSMLDLEFTNMRNSDGKANLTVFKEAPNRGHGVQMFRRENGKVSELEMKILKWIQASVK